jgi:hypothetical protein
VSLADVGETAVEVEGVQSCIFASSDSASASCVEVDQQTTPGSGPSTLTYEGSKVPLTAFAAPTTNAAKSNFPIPNLEMGAYIFLLFIMTYVTK